MKRRERRDDEHMTDWGDWFDDGPWALMPGGCAPWLVGDHSSAGFCRYCGRDVDSWADREFVWTFLCADCRDDRAVESDDD
jgi:hypothetical protein